MKPGLMANLILPPQIVICMDRGERGLAISVAIGLMVINCIIAFFDRRETP